MAIAALDMVARGGSGGPRFVFPLILLLLFLLLGGWFIRQRRGAVSAVSPGSPMATLQDRFARGEIGRTEFEHRKAVLLGEEEVPHIPEQPLAPPPPTDGPEEPPASDDDA